MLFARAFTRRNIILTLTFVGFFIALSTNSLANPLFALDTYAADIEFDENRHCFYVAYLSESRIEIFSATSFKKTSEIALTSPGLRLKLASDGNKLIVAHQTSSSLEIINLDNHSSEVINYSPGITHTFQDVIELNSGNLIITTRQGYYPTFYHINLSTLLVTEILDDLIQYPTNPVIRNNPVEEGFFAFKPQGVSDEMFRVAIDGNQASIVAQSLPGKSTNLHKISDDGSLILATDGLVSNTTDFWPRASLLGNFPTLNKNGTRIYTTNSHGEVYVFDSQTFRLLGTLDGPNFQPQNVLGGPSVSANFSEIFPTVSDDKIYLVETFGYTPAIAIAYPKNFTLPHHQYSARNVNYQFLESDPNRNVLYGSTDSEVHVISAPDLSIQKTYEFPATKTKGLDLRASGDELLVALHLGGSVGEIDLLTDTTSRRFVAPTVDSSKINDVQEIAENRVAFINASQTNTPYNAGLIREDFDDILSVAGGAELSGPFLAFGASTNSLFASEDAVVTKTDLSVEPGTYIGRVAEYGIGRGRTAPTLRPDGHVIVTGGGLVADTLLLSSITEIENGVHVFNGSGENLYSATYGGEFKVYDGQTFAELRSFPLPCKVTTVTSISLTAAEDYALVSGYHRESASAEYSVTCKVPVVTSPAADLRLEPLSPANLMVDGKTPFKFRIFNDGPNIAERVYFGIETSNSVELLGARIDGLQCSGRDTSWCEIPSINVGEFREVIVEASQKYTPQFLMSAVVSSEVHDPDSSNNRYSSFLESTYEISRYFPTTVGNSWDYEDLNGTNYTVEITSDSILINGVNTIEYARSDGLTNYFTNDENGLRWHAQRVEQRDFGDGVQRRAQVVFYPPVLVAPEQALPNDPISNSGIAKFNIQGIGAFDFNYSISSEIALVTYRTALERSVKVLFLNMNINLNGNVGGTPLSTREFNSLWLARDLGPTRILERDLDELDSDKVYSLVGTNLDRDGDGVLDAWDNCPDAANSGQLDNDFDKIGDACDENDDNDIASDIDDDFPFDGKRTRDFDNDGVDDTIDSDKDGDGILDYWEVEFNLNPYDSNDASLDFDGDAISNVEEFLNNSNPRVYNSSPQVLSIDMIPPQFVLLFALCIFLISYLSIRNHLGLRVRDVK